MYLRVKSITSEVYQILTLNFNEDLKTSLEVFARLLKIKIVSLPNGQAYDEIQRSSSMFEL